MGKQYNIANKVKKICNDAMVDVSSTIRVEPTATVYIVAGILATPAVQNNILI